MTDSNDSLTVKQALTELQILHDLNRSLGDYCGDASLISGVHEALVAIQEALDCRERAAIAAYLSQSSDLTKQRFLVEVERLSKVTPL